MRISDRCLYNINEEAKEIEYHIFEKDYMISNKRKFDNVENIIYTDIIDIMEDNTFIGILITNTHIIIFNNEVGIWESEYQIYKVIKNQGVLFYRADLAFFLNFKSSKSDGQYQIFELGVTNTEYVSHNDSGFILKIKGSSEICLVGFDNEEIVFNRMKCQKYDKLLPGFGIIIKEATIDNVKTVSILEDNENGDTDEKKIVGYGYSKDMFKLGQLCLTIIGKNHFHHYDKDKIEKQKFDLDSSDIMHNNKWEFHNTILFVYLKNNVTYAYGGTSLAVPETTKHVFTIKENYVCIDGDNNLIHFHIPKTKSLKDVKTVTIMDHYNINDEIIVLDHNWITNIVIFTCKIKTTNEIVYLRVNLENGKMITKNVESYEQPNINPMTMIHTRERPEQEITIALKYEYTKQEIITILASGGLQDYVLTVMVWHEDMTKEFFTRSLTWISKNINHLSKIKLNPLKPKVLTELKNKINCDRFTNLDHFIEDCAIVLCRSILQYRTHLPFKISLKLFSEETTTDVIFTKTLLRMFDLELFKNMSLVDKVYFVNGPE